MIAAEHALSLVVDDLATPQPSELSLDGHQREQIATLAGTALDRLCTSLESSEQEILTAADTIQRLRTLLNELSFPAGSAFASR